MITYELINPFDAYTFESSCHTSAAAVVFLLGEGAYTGETTDYDKELEVPAFLFGGAAEWFEEKFGTSLEKYLDENKERIAQVLSSLLIGKAVDRAAYYEGLNLIDDPVKKNKWRESWLDKRRSSCNNIGARAHAYEKIFSEGRVAVNG